MTKFKVGDKVIVKDCPTADQYYYTKAGSIGTVYGLDSGFFAGVLWEHVTGGDPITLPSKFLVKTSILELYLDVIVVDLID